MIKRSSGVLMSVSSLPGRYGIGGFGKETLDFIDSLSDMGFRYWQILPIGPLDTGNSPYAGNSAFAGNFLYIDPAALLKLGLVTQEEAGACEYDGSAYTADYAFAYKAKCTLLKQAFSRRTAEVEREVEAFTAQNDWLADYARYLTLKDKNKQRPWWEWGQEADYYSVDSFVNEETDFWCFVQYLFFKQWDEVKGYAHSKGVEIIGDMPIYVALDSCDVWSHPDLFQLDRQTRKPRKIAGVPPDYFSPDGQLWGNPLYDWKAMQSDDFSWWMRRIGVALSVYDVVRIDHFRALASYYAINSDENTAKNGEWEKGPGQQFFDVLKRQYPNAEIIAEDLGVFGQDVLDLLKSSGCPGMRVIQFGFDSVSNSAHLPHNYPENSVAYTGTHDNQTLLGWLWSAEEEERKFALDYCGFQGDNWGEGGFSAPACRKMVETVWRSSAALAVISFQDLCGFGDDARMNVPGIPEKNWRFRTTKETIGQIDRDYFRKINRIFKRTEK